jgi:HSP20 family protein
MSNWLEVSKGMSQRWDPIRDLMVLQDRMNQLFEDATERRARSGTDTSAGVRTSEWVPSADVYEEAEGYVVALDLPGVERSDLEIDLEDHQLTIKGIRSVRGQIEHRRERPQGKFSRSFSVPASVDQEQIAAEYKDGVLYVRLGKRSEPKAQRVEIRVS